MCGPFDRRPEGTQRDRRRRQRPRVVSRWDRLAANRPVKQGSTDGPTFICLTCSRMHGNSGAGLSSPKTSNKPIDAHGRDREFRTSPAAVVRRQTFALSPVRASPSVKMGPIELANREETEGAWIGFKKPILEALPVLDFRSIRGDQLKALATAFDEVADERLMPFLDIDADPVRKRIDDAISAAIGLPDLKPLRQLLEVEPVICLNRLGGEERPARYSADAPDVTD